ELRALNPKFATEPDGTAAWDQVNEKILTYEAIINDRFADEHSLDAHINALADSFEQLSKELPIRVPNRDIIRQVVTDAFDSLLTLRPEITASVVRALIEHDLLKQRGSWKLYYFGPAFRKERPQKGRYRQFHQFGIEVIGAKDPLVDAESILLFAEILRSVGVEKFEIRFNSIGCENCRPAFRDSVQQAARSRVDRFCADCKRRIDRNVLRLFDCKVEGCKTAAKELPRIQLCAPCADHDQRVRQTLGSSLPLKVDPTLVRGLDYYTQTVYEFSSPLLGAQDALGGGGRYNNLVKELSGGEYEAGAVGFAAGVERVLIAMEASRGAPEEAPGLDFYAVAVDESQRPALFGVVSRLRAAGLSGTMDFEGRSLKAQMRSADKLRARIAVILGPDEAARGVIKLKNLRAQGEAREQEVKIDEVATKLRGA
ncbi:MAG TPA: histidine--tRNA ligase, partial [Planctomycetota bacterium]|nr:histidine--tRNA ligase [Planctomycetota bacterium]